MKRLILFILILLSSIGDVASCGFYPYGDDVRFSMFNPGFPKFKEFDEFNYSANSFGPRYEWDGENPTVDYTLDENLRLWSARCNDIVALADIEQAIYESKAEDLVPTSSNLFIRQLYKQKDLAAIAYIQFAKKCSNYNVRFDDPWERHDYATIPGRKRLIEEAIKNVSTLKDKELVSRYVFLAIRLAYYNNEPALLQKMYATYFDANKTRKNVIDYWSMYFLCLTEKNVVKANFYAAQVFSNSADKRFMVSQQYNTGVPIDSTLQYAHTNEEKAAVWLLAGVKSPWKALSCMEKMYALDPNSKGLSFLLLRELNKLEDWIYTPLYTEFAPSIDGAEWEEEGNVSYDSIYKERIRKDRLYASSVLNFVKKVQLSTVYYPEFWKTAKAYLFVMTEQYQAALAEMNQQISITKKDVHVSDRLSMLKAFCDLAIQAKGAAVLTPGIKQEILNQEAHNNLKFIFAISKELEFRKNTTDAAILLSTLNKTESDQYEEYGGQGDIFWRTRQGSFLVWGNFYTNYFEYLDYQYTASQMKALINRVENANGTDAYSKWAYRRIRKEIGLLNDLIGTKFIRLNDLSSALYYFKQVPDELWNTGSYTYLDSNPFYTNFYNEHTYTDADTIKFTKVTLVQTLRKYIQLANNPQTKDRDYYYFLVANCYLNMTHYGNSWIMRRYSWSSGELWERQKKGDVDYYQADIAKQYYLKAKKCSKTKKFAALCLRMAGRCEKYYLRNTFKWNSQGEGNSVEDQIFEANKYYRQLKKEYPDDYDELISNCESFTPYFLARR